MKKTYEKPRLTKYGQLKDITKMAITASKTNKNQCPSVCQTPLLANRNNPKQGCC